MALHYSVPVRNAQLDAWATVIGTSPLVKIYTGSAPVDCATTASGSLLITITCPSTFMAAASGGTKAKSGTWSATASGTGTAGYYRIYDSAGTTCHEQGDIGTEMTLDNTSIASGQVVTIATYTKTAGDA